MRSLSLLVLLLASAWGQEPTEIPKQPVRNFKITRKDTRHDLKTNQDVEEITLILHGDEAIPIDPKKKIFDVRGVRASYFTDPDKDKLSKEIKVTAGKGHLDSEARTLHLQDNVRVVRRNDEETPPRTDTVLTASSLLLRFNKMYECPECRKLQVRKPQKRPGQCVDHNLPLKEATITSVEADRDFEITGPEGILAGEGLVTDDAINREYHIAKNGFAEFPSDVPINGADAKPTAPTEVKISQIFSRGPLEVTGGEFNRSLRGRDGTRIDRIDSSGTLTILAQEMTIDTVTAPAKAGEKAPAREVGNVDATGKVILEGVLFADGTSFHTTSDTLTRRLNGEYETTDLKSTGESLVHVKAGASTIESRSVRITRVKEALGGVSEFEDVERSDLVTGSQHLSLKCARLTTTAEPDAAGRTNLRKIVAVRNVQLGGLMSAGAQEDPGKADADYFEWDVAAQRGWLAATPLVRVQQGTSLITAPKILLESPNIFVLKGPKQVHLVQERDGAKEDYYATCEGDLVLDQATHRLTMRERCVIRTKDLLLHSDRVNAKLSEDGKGLDSLLALGRVRAVRQQDHMQLYGDRLAFRFKDQDLKVYGAPYAVADTGRAVSTQEQIRVYEKENPKTKQKVRYTELIGGPEGVRIEMEERPSDTAHSGGKKK